MKNLMADSESRTQMSFFSYLKPLLYLQPFFRFLDFVFGWDFPIWGVSWESFGVQRLPKRWVDDWEKKRRNISLIRPSNQHRVAAPLLNLPLKHLSGFVVQHDVVTHAKFGLDWLTRFRATGCQS